MGKQDRERRSQLIAGERRMKEADATQAVQRYRDLAKMSGCQEADEEQKFMALVMGSDWQPIECPHCGSTPSIQDLTKDRPSCEEIGHPGQTMFMGPISNGPVPCILCGETPDTTDADNMTVADEGQSISTISSPSPDHPDTCPNGHPEQMRRVMAGLPPIRCDRCGEIPVFSPVEFGAV